jgi:peptidoglycan hydrolase-like protein with peptidoglycan-binding domain
MTAPTTATSTSRPTGWIIATVIAAGLALTGIVTGLLLAFGPTAHTSKANAEDNFYPSNSSSTSGSSTSGGSSGHHHTPINPNPPVRPSQSIKLLQEQLGQLNYYNGPVTGYMNRGTVQAISYLQRDAHLPQTGQLNSATERALNAMLDGGNNQMNTNNGNVMNN